MSAVASIFHTGLRYLPDVVTLALDDGKCNGCRNCVEVCPHAVFAIHQKRARIIDRDACMECGACALNCPEGAITVNAGVGCAAAVISGTVRGTEPCCDCAGDSTTATCC
jgi:NAD-dependent dihydropyrimidine dehydrogenase PreA subunit